MVVIGITGRTVQAKPVPSSTKTFDIGFKHFLTPVLTTIVWWLSVFVVVLIVMVVTTSQSEAAAQVGTFLVGTIIGILELMILRLVLEFFVIAFRIERHLRDKNENK